MSDSDDDHGSGGVAGNTSTARQLHKDIGDEFGGDCAKIPLRICGVDPFARLNLRPVFAHEQKVLRIESARDAKRIERDEKQKRESAAAQQLQKKILNTADVVDDPFAAAAAAPAGKDTKKPPAKVPAKKPAAKRRQRADSPSTTMQEGQKLAGGGGGAPLLSDDDHDSDDDDVKVLRGRLLFLESNPRLPIQLPRTRIAANRWVDTTAAGTTQPAAALFCCERPAAADKKVVRLCSCCGRMARYRCPECFAGAKGSSNAVYSDPDGGLVCSFACFETHKQFRCGKFVQ